MGERDVLGSQLIRRNDELALLYEKAKLQGAALARGAVQYKDRRACAGGGLRGFALGALIWRGFCNAAATHALHNPCCTSRPA
jgi:hypothetical protein